MQYFVPDIIYVDESAVPYSITWEIVQKLPRIPVRRVRDKHEALSTLLDADDPVESGKHRLFLTTHKGRFFKKCPGTRGLLCCNYAVVNFATNCHLDCSYCILQSYYENNPLISFFVNTDDLLHELKEVFSADRQRVHRVGTGEFTDSLAMDDITQFSRIAVPFFAQQPNATLELKTKADIIDNLLPLDHQGHTSVAWSVNTPRMVASEEPQAATLAERLRAAARCQEAGYPIGFHFDPLFLYPGWEAEYRQVVEQIFDVVSPQNISWISLGGFRYAPDLKPIIRRRFSQSTILTGEFVPCADGKMRYFKHLRVALYEFMLAAIKRHGRHIPVYLCMESRQVWNQVYGWTPNLDADVAGLFDRRLRI